MAHNYPTMRWIFFVKTMIPMIIDAIVIAFVVQCMISIQYGSEESAAGVDKGNEC
jgi:hypothetical protein